MAQTADDDFIPARPTLYKGKRMRSRLEADFAARRLDAWGLRWDYEPECFASESGQWLPDFGSSFAPEGPFGMFTEVKPAEPLQQHLAGTTAFQDHVDAILRKMAVAWASRPDALLELIFWKWGEGPYLTLTGYKAGHPWQASASDGPLQLIWPGMGQYSRLRES